MSTWTAHATSPARPERVLDLLTDPGACTRWAPVDFEVSDLPGGRLVAGTRPRVRGRLAGRCVTFDLDVHAADHEHLALTASGPFDLDVEYRLAPQGAGSAVTASVAVRGARGIGGRVLAHATGALLAAGALRAVVDRIAADAAVV